MEALAVPFGSIYVLLEDLHGSADQLIDQQLIWPDCAESHVRCLDLGKQLIFHLCAKHHNADLTADPSIHYPHSNNCLSGDKCPKVK